MFRALLPAPRMQLGRVRVGVTVTVRVRVRFGVIVRTLTLSEL